MIQSMTGYGKAETTWNGKKIMAEIKSLNSKGMDPGARIAPLYREKEMELRTLLTEALGRGKVELMILSESSSKQTAALLNSDTVAEYVRQIRQISAEQGLENPSDWWNVLVQLPDVTARNITEELSGEEWQEVEQTVRRALAELIAFRRQEGEALEIKFREKIRNITALLSEVDAYEQLRVEKIRARLIEAVQVIPEATYDQIRLEKEMIYYIEKLDISEEKQRLTNHLAYFIDTMEQGDGQGKKLGFIAQEMGREINTLGSKSNLAELQNIVVKMKDELEQIKEQVLNVN